MGETPGYYAAITEGLVNSAELSKGLVSFFSSQADLLLAQYENINHFLGETSDWIHPGTLCEELLRHFLRTHLLSGMSVDKGYIYGRTNIEGKGSHCPEIDILIHDTRRFRPLYRMGNLVIVQPEAVLAMIQVKRTLTRGQLNRGIKNIVQARKHLLDTFGEKYPHRDAPSVFSAVVGFGDNIEKKWALYEELLSYWHTKQQSLEATSGKCTAIDALPDFVGSLKGGFVSPARRDTTRWLEYDCYDSYQKITPGGNEVKVSLQAMLIHLTNILWKGLDERPPFAFPKMTSLRSFKVPVQRVDNTN